jgi:hypothetical protein
MFILLERTGHKLSINAAQSLKICEWVRLNAMSICQMFRDLPSTLATSLNLCSGTQHFGKANGSLVAGELLDIID